jgi:leucyl/phenylalanyl-tRNA--protein transferase
VSITKRPRYFPPPETAGRHGILATGGKLTPEWLLDAYSHGIFPWPLGDRTLAWFSPDPRAIIDFADFHVSRRLRDTLRSRKFEIAFDRDFAGVIDGCATAQFRRYNTWITPEMREAYVRMHVLGHAHSVEAWCDGRLCGGTYGLAIGGVFAGESMFYHERDASKVALVGLVEHLQERGYALLDIQQLTSHTATFGAKEISRRDYLERLAAALPLSVTFSDDGEMTNV